MPIIKSAKKAARQTDKHTKHNIEIKKAIRSAVKFFKAHPTAKNLSKVQSEYDKAVKKQLLKKNTVARRKSALAKIAKTANIKLAPSKKPISKKPISKKPSTKTTPKKSPTKSST